MLATYTHPTKRTLAVSFDDGPETTCTLAQFLADNGDDDEAREIAEALGVDDFAMLGGGAGPTVMLRRVS